ncbi:M1 family aminopeptidase, partial [Gemmatimonadota bacterium]
DITFQYEGRITEWPAWSANILSNDWVEIGMYLPWFPLNPAYGDFTSDLEVTCDPAWQVRSFGSFEQEGDRWTFSQAQPVNDIVVMAARNLKTIHVPGKNPRMQVHYVTISEATASQLGDDLSSVVTLFDGWFGDIDRDYVTLVASPREQGGGYTRPGLIVLGGLDDEGFASGREVFLRYVGHEAAHLWWHNASPGTWQDWLNEGFAEFSALLVIEELFGPEAFQARLDEMAAAAVGTPPLWEFDRRDTSTPEKAAAIEGILYSKAPVLLQELRQRMGQKPFFRLCCQMVESGTSTTEAFLAIVAEISGTETAEWFETELRTR